MFYRTAGISYYTRRLTQALAKIGSLKLSVLLDRRDLDMAWIPASVSVIRTITPAHNRFERFTLPLELALRTAQFQVLHSPDFITASGRFCKVVTIHDLYFMEHSEVMTADAARYYQRIQWSARHADRIIAVSRFTADDIARLMPAVAHKVMVVHEAADTPAAPQAGVPPEPWAAQQAPFLLFVGTLEGRKNLATLLRAMHCLPSKSVDKSNEVRLIVAGAAGWGRNDAGTLANSLQLQGQVHFEGRVSDERLDTLYRTARALVMPSLSEGFGLPVLEAMARGTPVICSASGALPEIAGDAALMQPPMDHDALARNILAVWQDDALAADLSRRGLARAAQFSWTRAAAETIHVYRTALGR